MAGHSDAAEQAKGRGRRPLFIVVTVLGMALLALSLRSVFTRSAVLPDLAEVVERLRREGETRSIVSQDVVILKGTADFGDEDLQKLLQSVNPIVLDVSDTGVTDDGIDELTGRRRLSYLRLAGTRVTDVGLQKLGSVPKLRHLDLTRTEVTGAGIVDWPTTHRLESLWINETRLTDEVFRLLYERLNGMSVLSVAQTDVTDEAFTPPPFVRILNLAGTQVTADCLMSLGLAERDHLFGYLLWLDVSDTVIEPTDLAEIVNPQRYWLELLPRPMADAEVHWVEASIAVHAQEHIGMARRFSSLQRRQMRAQLDAARRLVGLHLTADLVGMPVDDLQPLISRAGGEERSIDLFGWSGEGMASLGVRCEQPHGPVTSFAITSPEW